MINHSTVRVSGLSVALAAIAALAVAPLLTAQQSGAPVSSFYDLKTSYLDGKPADLGAFRGKVTLVVNVASKCGFTPQYEGLEKLNRELAPKGFAVLGFPSNDFGAQEPGTAQEIAQFCKLTYDVTFPMFSKLVTKAGADQSPVYKFLGDVGPPAGVELQQVRHRQGRQGRRVLPERGDAGIAGAARRHHQGARGPVSTIIAAAPSTRTRDCGALRRTPDRASRPA